MSGYRDLKVWQRSKALAVTVYSITGENLWSRDWGLRDQVRRSAVSVPSNIAEGEARNSQKDSIRFFQIAIGSLAELSTQLEIASEIDYLKAKDHDELQLEIESLHKSIGALIKSRQKAAN